MRNIAHKVNTLRIATAQCAVKMQPSTLELVKDGRAPKGDPIPLARIAATMAAKNTSDIIPYCHPLLVDQVKVDFEFEVDTIFVRVMVTAVAKTGVEMEALTGASVAALTLYDMLKPVDESMEILGCKLLEKKGGKSSFPAGAPSGFKAGILVSSDRASKGIYEDTAGPRIAERLAGFGIADVETVIVPDEEDQIYTALEQFQAAGCQLIITTGGTGIGPRDVTVEATRRFIEVELDGVAEAIRSYGQSRTPYAMLSRATAGVRGNTIVINLAGSPSAVDDGISAVFPALFHVFTQILGAGH